MDEMMQWDQFLDALKLHGVSNDMQTSKTGRYPWLFHFCRGQAALLNEVVIYASINNYPMLKSPARDWTTEEKIKADYRALRDHGARFNDTEECLK